MRAAAVFFTLAFLTSPFWNLNPLALSEAQVSVILHLRIPRILCSFLAGSTLSLAGLILQHMLRNPLAGPYTLGLSSGASLFVATGLFLGLAPWTLPFLSFMGAMGMALVLFLAVSLTRAFSITSLLLMGMALGLLSSSVISIFQLLGGELGLSSFLVWTFGSTDVYGTAPVLVCALGFGILALFAHFKRAEITMVGVSESFAETRGVGVVKLQKAMFLATSTAVSLIVSQTGPIAFVGLIVPNIIKQMKGHLFREIFPTCLLFGGLFLSLADSLARQVEVVSLPIGAVTILFGTPYLVFLLLRP